MDYNYDLDAEQLRVVYRMFLFREIGNYYHASVLWFDVVFSAEHFLGAPKSRDRKHYHLSVEDQGVSFSTVDEILPSLDTDPNLK